MLSRVWKESARVPSSTRLTILRREMTGDPGWKRNAARPDRFAYPPNTSTQLSRDSSCSWARKKKSTQGKQRSPYFPFSVLQNSSLRKEYAKLRCDISDDFGEKKKRRFDRGDDKWFFENEKFEATVYPGPDSRAWGKNRKRMNNFPQDLSDFESRFTNTNFEATIKVAWNGYSSLFFVQMGSKGRKGRREKKRRGRRKKQRRKRRKKKQSIFEWITVNIIFSRVLQHRTELLRNYS